MLRFKKFQPVYSVLICRAGSAVDMLFVRACQRVIEPTNRAERGDFIPDDVSCHRCSVECYPEGNRCCLFVMQWHPGNNKDVSEEMLGAQGTWVLGAL